MGDYFKNIFVFIYKGAATRDICLAQHFEQNRVKAKIYIA